jgi:hypothetical protein
MKALHYLVTIALLATITLGLLIPATGPLWWLSAIALFCTRLIPNK